MSECVEPGRDELVISRRNNAPEHRQQIQKLRQRSRESSQKLRVLNRMGRFDRLTWQTKKSNTNHSVFKEQLKAFLIYLSAFPTRFSKPPSINLFQSVSPSASVWRNACTLHCPVASTSKHSKSTMSYSRTSSQKISARTSSSTPAACFHYSPMRH